ncbi:MAG: hypothetical protein M0Z98_01720 [Actinomycetales bacterium]|nr:hypothetical protein [Actinomycetales bacterium]
MTTYDDSLEILLPTQTGTVRPSPHRDDAGAAASAPVRPKPIRPVPAPGSPLYGDDLVAAPFSVSRYTQDQLARAIGLADPWLPASPQRADPLGLDPQVWAASLRDALSLAAIAVWVLCPEERSIRVTRRLDITVRGFLELRRMQRLEGRPTRTADEALRRVADVARQQNLRVTGYVPPGAALDAAAGHSTARRDLPAVRALLDAAAHGDPGAVERLSRIPVRLPRSSSPDTFDPSPSLGFRVALAAITSVVIYGETLYDAGRKAPR